MQNGGMREEVVELLVHTARARLVGFWMGKNVASLASVTDPPARDIQIQTNRRKQVKLTTATKGASLGRKRMYRPGRFWYGLLSVVAEYVQLD